MTSENTSDGRQPTRHQWAAWLELCTVEAGDELSDAERHGMLVAATHLLSDKGPAWAAGIDLDDSAVERLRARVWAAVEQGRAVHGPEAAR